MQNFGNFNKQADVSIHDVLMLSDRMNLSVFKHSKPAVTLALGRSRSRRTGLWDSSQKKSSAIALCSSPHSQANSDGCQCCKMLRAILLSQKLHERMRVSSYFLLRNFINFVTIAVGERERRDRGWDVEKSHSFVGVVEKKSFSVENLWRVCGEGQKTLWKDCGINGEK